MPLGSLNGAAASFLYFSLTSAHARVGEVEISNPVVCGRSEPDPALGINEEFPHYAEQVLFDESLEALNIVEIEGYGPTPKTFGGL